MKGRCLPAGLGALLACLLPGLALAEGYVRVLDCETLRRCDALGNCEEAAEPEAQQFRLEPLQLEADGSGRYELTYGDTPVQAQAYSEAGPFLWQLGEERHSLVASSQTHFLWHRLRLTPEPEAEIRFLACELRY